METQTMGREKTFNVRFSEEEWSRLDKLSEHYALTAAGVMRMLIKERHDEVAAAAQPSKVALRDEHATVIHLITDRARHPNWKPMRRDDMDEFYVGQPSEMESMGGLYPDADWSGGLMRVLNDLRRWGFLEKTPRGYIPTKKALAWSAPAPRATP